MKFAYLLILIVISTATNAVELRMSKLLSNVNWVPHNLAFQQNNPFQLTQSIPASFKSFDILDSSSANTLVIAAKSLSDIDLYSHYTDLQSNAKSSIYSHYAYFTEFQLAIKSDLMITGQWTRLHESYNDGYDSNRLLRPVEWSLVTESRTSAAREVGLNWTVFEGLQAFAKLQTVNSSAWIPQVSIPRFVTQDTENWTLAAVELVYTF
ncbi:hypothetical protein [Glaciecola sp. MF2-115]|uniref:hypothetical protein n=1 Tax=Glaciecola sp. MF2-115 TaxID=3384827 RepID=UPI0039A05E8F